MQYKDMTTKEKLAAINATIKVIEQSDLAGRELMSNFSKLIPALPGTLRHLEKERDILFRNLGQETFGAVSSSRPKEPKNKKIKVEEIIE